MNLNKQEVEQFHALGYVIKPDVFDDAALESIKTALTALIDDRARQLQAEGVLTQTYADSPFETRLADIQQESREAAQAVIQHIQGKGGGGYSGPAMLAMLRHQPLLDCIEALIGPDIVGSSVYRIRPKLPTWERGEVPWHQDSGYFMAHCDQHLIVTCWIPLVDATVENGCLWVVPKAHHDGIIRHYSGGHGGYLEIVDDDLPPREPIPVPMTAGSVLFMTNLTPHASFENHTNQVRWSVDLRYQGVDAPNNVGETPADYVPERDPVTMACYPPEADFIIRDTHDPTREIHTAEAFTALRERFEKERAYFPGRGWQSLSDKPGD